MQSWMKAECIWCSPTDLRWYDVTAILWEKHHKTVFHQSSFWFVYPRSFRTKRRRIQNSASVNLKRATQFLCNMRKTTPKRDGPQKWVCSHHHKWVVLSFKMSEWNIWNWPEPLPPPPKPIFATFFKMMASLNWATQKSRTLGTCFWLISFLLNIFSF